MTQFPLPLPHGGSASSPVLPVPPRAEVLPIEDLVRNVLSGQVRIPEFQREWQWKAQDIRNLFDSLYRGYPIGSLLMWRRERGAEELSIGPCRIIAVPRADAWAVVDGQQRLTAIVGVLAHPDARPDPDDMFSVWFDPTEDTFKPTPDRSAVPETWVPVSRLLDSAALQEFIFERPVFSRRKDLRQKVFEAGKRLREYRIPIYVVDTDEQAIPREIFRRINRHGTRLAETDLFNALVGRAPSHPQRLEDLQKEAADLGMGEIPPHKLLQCVMSVHGLDVTRRFDEQRGQLAVADALAATALPLRAALAFIRAEARIPHLRLLPYPVPLVVLTRFFSLHTEPSPRCRDLLVRWVWRGMLTGVHEHGERTRLRDAVRAVGPGDGEDSAQALLRSVPREPRDVEWWLDASFDGRSAASRIAELAIVDWSPRHLRTCEEIDVAALLDALGPRAFRRVLPNGEADVITSPANRLLHPSPVKVRGLVELARRHDPEAVETLRSHGFDQAATAALEGGDAESVVKALDCRREMLRSHTRHLGFRLARWGHSDRKSIASLLAGGGRD